jgi:hypothetical protein
MVPLRNPLRSHLVGGCILIQLKEEDMKILLTLFLAVASGTLQADVMTETFGPSGYVSDDGLVGFWVPEFNPALGTLMSMSWGIDANFQLAATGSNCYGTEPIVIPWEATTALSFFGSTVQSTDTGTLTLEPGICARTGFIDTSLNASNITIPSTSGFIGTGYVPESSNATVTWEPSGGYTAGPGPLGDFGEGSGAIFTITYTYCPTPEPRVIIPLLSGVSLMLLVLWRRHRRLG